MLGFKYFFFLFFFFIYKKDCKGISSLNKNNNKEWKKIKEKKWKGNVYTFKT